MPPRNNPLEEYFNQFVDVRRVVESTERNSVWATTNGFRAQRTYIDEMADHWRARLDDEIRDRIYEELTRPFEIEHEPVATAAATEATFTANNTFVNEDWSNLLPYDLDTAFGAYQTLFAPIGDLKLSFVVAPRIATMDEVELEDVDLDEFEKILNGG